MEITKNAYFARFGHLVVLLLSSILNESSYFFAQTNSIDVEPSVCYRVQLVVEVDKTRLQYRVRPHSC